ncbi:MAG TPA: hypothetical protein VGK74_12980 [Symbiobacteriaceae bacterium]|jgi:hypothetical protein
MERWIAAVVWSALGVAAFLLYYMTTLHVHLPESWQEFHRTAYVQGKDAIAEIGRLHKQPIDLSRGYRADYDGRCRQFTVWVAVKTNADEARTLLEEMTGRTGSGYAVLSPSALVRRGGLTAYRSAGMGQTDFHYVKGTAVYWVAITAPDPDDLVMHIILDF